MIISGIDTQTIRYPNQSEIVAKRSIETITALRWFFLESKMVPTDIAMAKAAIDKPINNVLKDSINNS